MTQATSVCNLCGAAVVRKPEPQKISDICPGCKLRTRHRAYGALCAEIGDPTRVGKTLICHASREELDFLFAGAASKYNFDIRPSDILDGVMDIQNMAAVADQSQDTFIALHVMQQVRDDRKALSEIARVLKPDGVAIFTVPFRRGGRTEPYPKVTEPYGQDALDKYDVGTFRRYGYEDFMRLLDPWFVASTYTFLDPTSGEQSSIFIGRRLGIETRKL